MPIVFNTPIELIAPEPRTDQAEALPSPPSLLLGRPCVTLTSQSDGSDIGYSRQNYRSVSTLQYGVHSVPPQLRILTPSPSPSPSMAEEPRERDEEGAHLRDLERGQYHVPRGVVVPLKPFLPYHTDGPHSFQDPRKAADNKDIKSGGQSLLTGK
jgi:hypothetical protein